MRVLFRRAGLGRVAPSGRSRLVVLAMLLPLVLGTAATASAHEEPYSYLDVRVEQGQLRGKLAAHMVDLAHEAGLAAPESLLMRPYAERHITALHEVLGTHLHLEADGRRVQPVWGALAIQPERRSLSFEWTAPIARPPAVLALHGPMFPYDPPHETYVNVYEGDALRHQDLLDKKRTSFTLYSGSRQGRWAVVRTFVIQGIHHIFIGPDHILFVIGLLLLGGGLLRLLKIVTAFTIAHSVTLALATLRLVDPPARLIEPVIALSIVLIGIETLIAIRRKRDWRVPIAFAFGLVHGFGFASVLRDLGLPANALGWSLAAFNVGVELGQACIVVLIAPALAALRDRRPDTARRVVTWGAASIIVAGAFWFVERVL